ncbi:MAG: LytTR family DNA-binding domain-containing protein [Clostridia bacterium]|nr:LytTR family DNA-binding domain-containing protein [Clostridia bacterium]
MNKILIIEDEILSANRLKRMLLDIDDMIEIYGPIQSVEGVVETLHTHNTFDCIFADIRLKERLVFEAFQEVMPCCPVVFTTAYDEYALKAFRNNGIDYLLKPIDADELSAAYCKAEQICATETSQKLQSVSKELKCYRERILIAKGEELIPLKVSDISYIHTEGNIVTAYTFDGESYLLNLKMAELEGMLNPDVFFRLNRQYIAHIDSIQKINLFFNNKLCIKIKGCKEDLIVVSKEKSASFRNWLNR